jgi:TonB family protein
VLLCCLSARAAAQGPPPDFKQLYAAAEYEQALVVLAPLKTAEAFQYKALCLLALGRQDEADAATEDLVSTAPTFVPSPAETPPRFVDLVASVRRELLPVIARRYFAEGRDRFAAKKPEEAIARFSLVLTLAADPAFEDATAAQDLTTLAQGFIDLAKATAAATAPVEVAAAAEPVRPPPPAATPPQVTQAVPLEQNVPSVPSEVVGRIGPATVVAVVIDATGKVTDVSVRQSSHPLYDRLVLQAARDWRYEPATINGVPVPSERLVTIQTAR